jgi:hypothetical protein
MGGGDRILKCKIKLYIDMASTSRSRENYSDMTSFGHMALLSSFMLYG